MTKEFLITPLTGVIFSMFFGPLTNNDAFPETMRYGIGCLGIAVAMSLCGIEPQVVRRFVYHATLFGTGVVIARWLR